MYSLGPRYFADLRINILRGSTHAFVITKMTVRGHAPAVLPGAHPAPDQRRRSNPPYQEQAGEAGQRTQELEGRPEMADPEVYERASLPAAESGPRNHNPAPDAER